MNKKEKIEEKEVVEVPKKEEKNSSTKIFIIVFILIMSIILMVGVALAVKVTNDKKENKTETKEEMKSEDKKEDNKKEEEKEEEKEETQQLVMDDYFLNHNLNLTAEDRITLINDTNAKGWIDKLHGAAFKTPLSDEFKLYYTLSKYTFAIVNEMPSDIYGTTLEIKITTIEKSAKNIFTEFTMPTNIDKTIFYKGLSNLECNEEKCTYDITTAGIEAPFINGYMTKPEINGNVITVKPIYVICEKAEEVTNQDELELDLTLYDTTTLKPIKEVKNFIPLDGSTEEEYNAKNYDALVNNYETLETFKYTFTDDFKLISVEKE